MEDNAERKFTITVTHEEMTEQIIVKGMKKGSKVSLVELAIFFGTDSFMKTQKEIGNVTTASNFF